MLIAICDTNKTRKGAVKRDGDVITVKVVDGRRAVDLQEHFSDELLKQCTFSKIVDGPLEASMKRNGEIYRDYPYAEFEDVVEDGVVQGQKMKTRSTKRVDFTRMTPIERSRQRDRQQKTNKLFEAGVLRNG